MVTAGNRNDCTQAEAVIGKIRVPGRTTSSRTRATPPARSGPTSAGVGSRPPSPNEPTNFVGRKWRRERPCAFGKTAYGRRNVVERCFHRFKQWRGIALHYDERPDRYLAAITLACTLVRLDQ